MRLEKESTTHCARRDVTGRSSFESFGTNLRYTFSRPEAARLLNVDRHGHNGKALPLSWRSAARRREKSCATNIISVRSPTGRFPRREFQVGTPQTLEERVEIQHMGGGVRVEDDDVVLIHHNVDSLDKPARRGAYDCAEFGATEEPGEWVKTP